MIVINSPKKFIDTLMKTTNEFNLLVGDSVQLLSYEHTFTLLMYGDEINQKIKDELMFKEKYSTSSLIDVLCYLENKSLDKRSNDDIESLSFDGIKEFIILNKSMFYISSLMNKSIQDMTLLSSILRDDELMSALEKKYLFNNLLFKNILTLSEDPKLYASIQFRVQDSFYICANMNQENFDKLIALREEKFFDNVKMKDFLIEWPSKLASSTKHGVDWKILNNVWSSISKLILKKQRVNEILYTFGSLNDKRAIERKIIFKELNNALDNVEILLNRWRKFEGYLHYSIYKEIVSDTLSEIKQFKKNEEFNSENSDLYKIIQKIEKLLNVDNLKAATNRTIIYLPSSKVSHYLKINEKIEFENILAAVHKVICLYIFSKEYNGNSKLYSCEYKLAMQSKNVVGAIFELNYSSDFGVYLTKKIEDAFLKIFEGVASTYIQNLDESSNTYKNMFNDFLKECNAIILENKIMVNSLSEYNKSGKEKKKI